MKMVGDQYENEAAKMISAKGMRILSRNFLAKTGEIDIIALDGEYLVFIEVRARSNPHFLSAAASVDRRKQLKILRTAQVFRQRNKQLAHLPCRFDVIAFEARQSNHNDTHRWIRSAFTA
ncbi:MAG: putative endonuclease [Halioglobus sp.]|jgi:putative endonuclease